MSAKTITIGKFVYKHYIDREEMLSAVCRGCNEEFSDAPCEPSCCTILRELKKIPTADVVEVVRCKDCIYYAANNCINRQWDLESSTEVPMGRDFDFCSYGERKEQE